MAGSGSNFMSELSTTVTARMLSATICGLLPAEMSSSGSITKAELRHLCEASFEWPSLDSLRPKALLALPKNITKNFVGYFHEKGHGLVTLEASKMNEQVLLWSPNILCPALLTSQYLTRG